MLNWLVGHSIRYRGIVVALAALLLGYGVYSLRHAELDVFPNFVPPQAVIQTEAPGMPPEQVETLVTRLVESALAGVPRVESIRSQSIAGLSIVTVVFDGHADILTARQLLAEQLGTVTGNLPVGVQAPKLTPLTSATMDLLKIGLVSESKSLMELRAFADWVVKPRLQAAAGVASVGIMGGETRQIQIQIDPQRLAALQLGITDVLNAARNATGVRAAGYIETENQRVILQAEGQALTPEQVGQTLIVRHAGAAVRLADVANVVEAAAPKYGDALIQGRPGVLIKLLSQYGANTMDATIAAEKALEELRPVLAAADIQVFPRMHRPATFIETALHHVNRSLLMGGGLVVLVLFLFLLNLRTAFVSIIAIPLSLLVAVMVLQWMGITLNTITLGGLAIAIGEVVDDAIIDVENILRRLRQNAAAGTKRPVWKVVLDASIEVRSAVVYATFVVILVFVPVLTLSGLQGRMFAPLGVAYILAILASLLIALTITPALSCFLLPATAGRPEPMLLRGLKSAYSAIIRRAIGWPWMIIVACLLLIGVGVWATTRFGNEFLPEFREGHFVAQVSAVPGTSLGEMMRAGEKLSQRLLNEVEIDGQKMIDTVELQAGRAELGEDPWGPQRGEFHIELKADVPGHQQAQVQEQIREIVECPGMSGEVVTFLGDRISETITGETAPIVMNIFGDDLDQLDRFAQELAAEAGKVSGATDVKVVSPPGAPFMTARLRADRLAFYGFQALDALSAIETAYQGTRVAQTYEAGRSYDVTVILRPELRRDPELVGDLLLRSPGGQTVPLRELADIEASSGRYMILHDGARRRQTVTCNVTGRDLKSVVADLKAQIGRLKPPANAYVEFAGQEETRAEAQQELLLHSGFAGFGILILLTMIFTRPRNLLLVLANLPFAFVGGVLAVWLTSHTLSIGSLVGFVTLFGITMRNSMMMISHFEHVVREERLDWGIEAAVRGASERLIPIMMTALVTGLGLLPIALGAGEVGREIEGPMAIVIFGGLVTSTLLNLLVLPTLAVRFGRFDPSHEAEVAAA